MDRNPQDTHHHPITPLPVEGSAVEVATGVFWIRLPLPFALDHINVWLMDDGAGWTLVDSGVSSNRTRSVWERIFATALAGRPVTRVIATHFHPDHVGLAGWLVDRWDAVFCTSLTEWLFGRMLSLQSTEHLVAEMVPFYRRAGVGAAMLETLTARGNAYAQSVTPLPGTLHRLRDGDDLTIGSTQWRVIIGGGHTPEHVCLYAAEPALLIAGDQVLPRISPNISVWPSEPEADPLGDFFASLERLRALPANTLVLPSHGEPFTGLHGRLDELTAHHRARLDQVMALCAEPMTAAEVTAAMFDRLLDAHQTVFAIGEAIAHLNHLANQGRIGRAVGADGIVRYEQRPS